MKKLLTMLAGLCMGTLCFAQLMMEDNAVQICAYWDKGDTMVYNYKQTNTTSQDGVTVSSVNTQETHVFEVTEATEHSYVLKTSFEDVLSSVVSPDVMTEVAERVSEHFWFETLTDEFGSIQDIVNTDNAIEAARAMIPVIANRVLDKYTDQELAEEGTSRDQVIQAFTNGLCTESFIDGLCVKYVVPLLVYHGALLNIGEEYTIKDDIDDILGSGELELNYKFWIEPEECTEDFVIIRSYVEADKEDLTPILKERLIALQEDLTEDDLDEMVAQVDAKLEEYSNIVIHLGSGWPVRWWWNRETTLVDEDGTITVLSEEKELIINEEDPRNNG